MPSRPYRKIFFANNDFPFVCWFCGEEITGILIVHHKNHDRSDHSVENLVGVHKGCHNKVHVFSGKKHSEETLLRMSTKQTTRQADPDLRNYMKEKLAGRITYPFTPERRKRETRTCECGLITLAGAMGMHQKWTGHGRQTKEDT